MNDQVSNIVSPFYENWRPTNRGLKFYIEKFHAYVMRKIKDIFVLSEKESCAIFSKNSWIFLSDMNGQVSSAIHHLSLSPTEAILKFAPRAGY